MNIALLIVIAFAALLPIEACIIPTVQSAAEKWAYNKDFRL